MDPVVLLAAGLGTRLRPLSEECPKPLVWLGDRRAIDHLVERARRGGAMVAANAHHHLAAMRAWAGTANVPLSEEPAEPLGTAGGVFRLRALVGGGPLWIHNSDIDAPALDLASYPRDGRSRALLLVTPRPRGEGNVGLVGDRIVRLRRERFAEEESGGDFLGVHWLAGDVTLPERGCMVGDVYLPLLRAGATLSARAFADPWCDIGSLQGYLAANLAWLARSSKDTFVAAGAVMGASCTQTVVLERAEVFAACRRVIVWPDARVREPLENAVVTPRGVVPIPPVG